MEYFKMCRIQHRNVQFPIPLPDEQTVENVQAAIEKGLALGSLAEEEQLLLEDPTKFQYSILEMRESGFNGTFFGAWAPRIIGTTVWNEVMRIRKKTLEGNEEEPLLDDNKMKCLEFFEKINSSKELLTFFVESMTLSNRLFAFPDGKMQAFICGGADITSNRFVARLTQLQRDMPIKATNLHRFAEVAYIQRFIAPDQGQGQGQGLGQDQDQGLGLGLDFERVGVGLLEVLPAEVLLIEHFIWIKLVGLENMEHQVLPVVVLTNTTGHECLTIHTFWPDDYSSIQFDFFGLTLALYPSDMQPDPFRVLLPNAPIDISSNNFCPGGFVTEYTLSVTPLSALVDGDEGKYTVKGVTNDDIRMRMDFDFDVQ